MRALLLVALIWSADALGYSCEPLTNRVEEAVVHVGFEQTKGGWQLGTAWQVLPGVYITAAHVTGDSHTGIDQQMNPYAVIYRNKDTDVAVLQSPNKASYVLRLGGPTSFGDQVWSVAFFGTNDTISISTGFVLNTEYHTKMIPGVPFMFSFGATGWSGASGSPVLMCSDGEWSVVGMLVALYGTDDHMFSDLSLAIPVEVIREVIESIL